MARPFSEEKRRAILESSARIISEQGLSATTAFIAKEAGISTGSLFTYFPDKNSLLNQLYLDIKAEVATALMYKFPFTASLKDRTYHVWTCYISWAVRHPEKHSAVQQLHLSKILNAQTRVIAEMLFESVYYLLRELSKVEIYGGEGFISAFMASLSDITVTSILEHPDKTVEYTESGFGLFWRALDV
ncbi:TetR/AcrR family transcriptional regulator [Scandinavium goeteborgense]|uniref:TetR/AcrR family transcriptional regulator n=1 Tax=Scandinavium goeteborgense TaxID=1851514 RepID=UPI003817FB4B